MTDAAGQAPKDEAPKDVIGFLDYYLVKKAPFQIPDAGREFLVKFGPWIMLILMLLTLPLILFLLGIGTVLSPFGGVNGMATWGLSSILLLVQFGLRAAALPGLFARKMMGWNLVFYALLVGLLASILSFYSIIGGLIGALIGLYILFQIRPLYH
jgi:hypothetical protein